MICLTEPEKSPRSSRYVSHPNARTEAPMWMEFSAPVSQTPTPPTTQTTAVAASQRPVPPKRIRKPKTSNGTVLAAQWAHPACNMGAKRLPSGPAPSRPRPGAVKPVPNRDIDDFHDIQQGHERGREQCGGLHPR